MLAGLGSGAETAGAAAGATAAGAFPNRRPQRFRCSDQRYDREEASGAVQLRKGRDGLGFCRLSVMMVGGAAFNGFLTVAGVLTTVAGSRFTGSGCWDGAGFASAEGLQLWMSSVQAKRLRSRPSGAADATGRKAHFRGRV